MDKFTAHTLIVPLTLHIPICMGIGRIVILDTADLYLLETPLAEWYW